MMMDSCMTVSVPANHSIMISFASIDLDDCCDCDFVHFFFTRACTGPPAEILCHNSFDPTVYTTDYFSLRFKSSWDTQRTGFRLLFSFHPVSERPTQVEGGKWDCAVPGAFVWMQHFLCSPETFCDGTEDRSIGGCPSADLCGPSVVALDGRCYRYISPPRQVSWDEAEGMCQTNNGHLVSLSTQQEWSSILGWMVASKNYDAEESKHLMVGLRLKAFPRHDT